MLPDVQFILPGLFDNWYPLGAWWIFGYSVYASLMTSCILLVDSYSSIVALFMGDFSKSYYAGATFCNEAVRPLW
jgi:hypothetical protein